VLLLNLSDKLCVAALQKEMKEKEAALQELQKKVSGRGGMEYIYIVLGGC
jgi:hypothetical protein